MSHRVQLTWLAAALYAVALAGPSATVAEEADPTALRAASRAVLDRAMRSPDAFERWAGLRAARQLGDPALADAARTHLQSGARYEEALALEILARTDPEGSRGDFISALDSPYRTTRLRALRALQPHPDHGLVARLAILAIEDGDPDIRVLAIRTLKQWALPEAVPPLRRGLDDPVAAVQQETVKALAALGDPQLAANVRQRIVDGPPEGRIAALRLAALVPDGDLLEAVAPFLNDANPEVRVAAAASVLAGLQRAEAGR